VSVQRKGSVFIAARGGLLANSLPFVLAVSCYLVDLGVCALSSTISVCYFILEVLLFLAFLVLVVYCLACIVHRFGIGLETPKMSRFIFLFIIVKRKLG